MQDREVVKEITKILMFHFMFIVCIYQSRIKCGK